jgi:hypothetical protein
MGRVLLQHQRVGLLVAQGGGCTRGQQSEWAWMAWVWTLPPSAAAGSVHCSCQVGVDIWPVLGIVKPPCVLPLPIIMMRLSHRHVACILCLLLQASFVVIVLVCHDSLSISYHSTTNWVLPLPPRVPFLLARPAGPLFSHLPSLRAFLRELKPLLGSAGTAAALSAVDDLQALGQLLLDWGVHRDQLLLEPLLTPQAEYFSGTLFQVSLYCSSGSKCRAWAAVLIGWSSVGEVASIGAGSQAVAACALCRGSRVLAVCSIPPAAASESVKHEAHYRLMWVRNAMRTHMQGRTQSPESKHRYRW